MTLALFAPLAAAAPVAGLPSLAPLVEQVEPAVVAIEVEGKEARDAGEPSAETDRDPDRGPPHSEGSGFVISAGGRVLTNNHVVEDAAKITARFVDGSEVALTVVGVDRATDVALLQLAGERTDWPFAALGTSGDLRVGDWVVAVGNPLGLGLTVTTGVVSAKSRAIGRNALDDFIQTDAAINRGNSGGPLFDLGGRVVGMNTAVARDANDVGFAVPIDLITGLLPELERGRVQRGYLGLQFQKLDPVLGRALAADHGVVVIEVHPDEPGAAAGLEPGDVITTVGAADVSDGETLVQALAAHRPGETVAVEIVRDGRRKTIQAEMTEPREDQTELPRTEATPLGVVLVPASEKVLFRARVREGVLIDEVFSTGASAKVLRPGDVLVEVDGKPVTAPDEVLHLLARRTGPLAMRISRGGSGHYVAVDLAEPAARP
jgi:serine protease Do